jgi:TonB family protein
MFARLIGSAPVHQQSASASCASLVLHATLLGLAIHLSAHGFATRDPDVLPEHLIFHAVPDVPAPIRRAPAEPPLPCECTPPDIPVPNTPFEAPTEIPVTISDPGPIIIGHAGDPSAAAGGDSAGGVFAPTVDIPARALPGNPQPAYPALLRGARVEGVVAAHFVVDTTGRVDAHSIAFESGGEPLFESAVRRALLASRYEPARTGGRPVAMRVEQIFAFRITP